MSQQDVAAELQEIAARMRQASIAQRDKPYELKKTARYLGQRAAKILSPILRDSGESPMAPLWHKGWVIRGLRNQLRYFCGFDGDAVRRKPVEFEQPDSLDVNEDEIERWLKDEASAEQRTASPSDPITEGEMLLEEIADFYFEQTEHWANMLELVSGRLLASAGDDSAADGPYPPNTWQRGGVSFLPLQMSDRAWKLVSFLWDQDQKSATALTIAERYDEKVDLISLPDWQKDANGFFRFAKINWSILKTGGKKEPVYTLANRPPRPVVSRKRKKK